MYYTRYYSQCIALLLVMSKVVQVIAGVDNTTIGVLEKLYISTQGEQWRYNTNWLEGDPCTNKWFGIGCASNNTVASIYLKNNKLNGTLPQELWSITSLVELNLSQNNLTGTLDGNWSTFLLERFDVSYNQLTGTIPSGFSDFTKMTKLVITDNDINGVIPSLEKLVNLQYLKLARMPLTGNIPDMFTSLTKLTHIDITYTNITGTLPSSIGELPDLSILYLDGNHLEGPFPASFSDLTNMIELAACCNLNLNGTVLMIVAKQTKLRKLWLGFNNFTGEISDEFRGGVARILVELDLQSNQFVGQPWRINDFTQLKSLNLARNNFNGLFPTLAHLLQLQHLDMSSNSFFGPISTAGLQKLPLQSLNIENNAISGTLSYLPPSLLSIRASANNFSGELVELTTLSRLQYLDVSSNQLNGTIPIALGSLVNLTTLYLHNNTFSGELPQFLHTKPTKITNINVRCNQYTLPLPAWCVCGACQMCDTLCGNCKQDDEEDCDPPNSECCSNECGYVGDDVVCNAAPINNTCAITQYCSGRSATCAPIAYKEENSFCGQRCGTEAYCKNKECVQEIGEEIKVCELGLCSMISGECECADPSLPYPLCSHPFCGDGDCASDENCTNCIADCGGYCPVGCEVTCQNGGGCENGVCVCNDGWTGVSCENEVATLNFGKNESQPTTFFLSRANYTGFLLNFNEISEIDKTSGRKFTTYSLRNLTYVCNEINTDDVSSFSCCSTFSNGGQINFTMAHYITQHNTTFAGRNYVIPPQTVKLTVKLYTWPFRTIRNQLVLDLSTEAERKICNVSTVVLGMGSNGSSIRSFSLSNGVSTLYGTFDDKIEVDDKPQYVITAYDYTSSSILITIPFFWNTVLIDPNYNVLLNSLPEPKIEEEICESPEPVNNTFNSAVIIGLCVSIPGCILIAAGVLFYLKREKSKRELRRLRSKANSIQLT